MFGGGGGWTSNLTDNLSSWMFKDVNWWKSSKQSPKVGYSKMADPSSSLGRHKIQKRISYCWYFFTFECNDLAGWIHDGAVSWDGPADGGIGVRHVDDDHLRLLAHLLSDADEFIRLHGQGAEADVGWINPQVLKLRRQTERGPDRAFSQIATAGS